MSYLKQRVIVLRKKTIRHGNRWYVLLCQNKGKLDVLVRSAASSKSKLAGHLEPGTMAEVMLAPGKNIIHLAGVKNVKVYNNIALDLDSNLLKITALAVTNDLIYEEDEATQAFNLLDNFLSDLDNQDLAIYQKKRLLDLYIISLLSLVGFAPNLSLGQKAKHFSIAQASLINSDSFDKWSIRVDEKLIKLFELMLKKELNWEDKKEWLVKIKKTEVAFNNLHELINRYYTYQINKELIFIS